MNYRETFVNIDLAAIHHNILELKKSAPVGSSLMAVIKGDAYGHGDVQVLKTAAAAGVEWAGVAIVREAIKVREINDKIHILLLGYCPSGAYREIVDKKITITIHSLETAFLANSYASQNKIQIPVHLKLETGMSRLGFTESQLIEFLSNSQYFSHLKIDGISSHLSSADEGNPDFSHRQIQKYYYLVDLIKKQFEPQWLHIVNSAGITEFSEKRGNLFRMGISMYGQMPSSHLQFPPLLKEALTFKSFIIQLQDYAENTPIGYGRTFITKRQTKIATIAVGYADGYSRLLSNKGQVLIAGQRAPVIGNVCMDMIMVDVTKIECKEGDKVIIFNNQEMIQNIANISETIVYETLTAISQRVKKTLKY